MADPNTVAGSMGNRPPVMSVAEFMRGPPARGAAIELMEPVTPFAKLVSDVDKALTKVHQYKLTKQLEYTLGKSEKPNQALLDRLLTNAYQLYSFRRAIADSKLSLEEDKKKAYNKLFTFQNANMRTDPTEEELRMLLINLVSKMPKELQTEFEEYAQKGGRRRKSRGRKARKTRRRS